MGRRTDIDWEAIERDYRAGALSVLALARAHEVSSSQVRVKAQKHGWTRDLSAAIEARTRAKISAIDISTIVEESARLSADKSAESIRSAIEHASDIATGIIIKHRASLRADIERARSVEALFDEHMSSVESVRDIATLAQAFKSVVDAKAKIMEQERQAFGIKDDPTGVNVTVTHEQAIKALLNDPDE